MNGLEIRRMQSDSCKILKLNLKIKENKHKSRELHHLKGKKNAFLI